jgi:hypothetical protein
LGELFRPQHGYGEVVYIYADVLIDVTVRSHPYIRLRFARGEPFIAKATRETLVPPET